MNALLLLDQRVFWSIIAAGVIGVLAVAAGIVGIVHHYRRELAEARAETAEWKASAQMQAAAVEFVNASPGALPKREPQMRGGGPC